MFDETIAQLEPVVSELHRPHTILVVDDDESQVVALEHRLKKQGYRVLTAFTGRQARHVTRDECPDLVVLDLRLPDADGLALCSELTDAPGMTNVPVIILTALERPDIVRLTRSVGGLYYLRKPYDPNVLLTLIEESLGRLANAD